MTALPSPLPNPVRFTVPEYHRLAEVGILRGDVRYELIDGQIIHMSPIGRRHAGIVSRLGELFYKLRRQAIVWIQNPVQVDDRGEPQPDITLLKRRADHYEAIAPGPRDVYLMVEVADSSLTFDLNVKRSYYAKHGICELWVVDTARRVIHVCRDPVKGEYRTVFQAQGKDKLAPLAFPKLVTTVRKMIG